MGTVGLDNGAGQSMLVASGELRVAVTRLSRRLRAQNPFPSLAQAAVLAHLFDDGPKTTSWLAAAERVRAQSMAQVIRDLEDAGLVTRWPDTIDRRQVIVEITPSGREALLEDRRRRDEWFTQVIEERFTPKERALLLGAIPLLARLSAP
jgi:DNA-binding MarR family transcriptional regulator